MTQLNMLFGALFRPKATFTRLGEGVKWAWLPALAVLIAASLANVVVGTPLSTEAVMAWAESQEASMEGQGPGGGRVVIKEGTGVKMEAGPVDESDLVEPQRAPAEGMEALAITSGLVFGVVGVLFSLFATATFFLVAGKVWAKRVTFATYVSMVALASMPLAARSLLQAVYQAVTGTWIQHQGISALVASKDVFEQTGAAYGILSQIDVWSIWTLILLFVGLRYATSFEKKRASIALGIFAVVTVLLRAAPAIVFGAFAGA